MRRPPRAALRWAVFVGLVVTSFALYWAGTSAGPLSQGLLLMLLVLIAIVAALVR